MKNFVKKDSFNGEDNQWKKRKNTVSLRLMIQNWEINTTNNLNKYLYLPVKIEINIESFQRFSLNIKFSYE